jgi:tRNA-2-methylthio-N6-dimethylallyladenosine synthase
MRKSNVYIETFGCQMNVADTERAATGLRGAGYHLTERIDDADIVLFNTCSVRARAEQKVFNRVGSVRLGEKKPVLGIMGCVAQLEGDSLFESAPGISLVVGTRATDRLASLIERVKAGERKVIDLGERQAGEEWNVSPVERRSPYVAFVPIIEGCNKFCTYCIVPYSRGREQSRPATEIIDEIARLHDLGYKEVQLIGQNVNSYRPRSSVGLEGFAGATPFARLLHAAAATGIPRIKFTTSFPRDFHPDIVSALDEHENLCNWIHLPVQSGSDRVLRAMRRGYKVADYLARVEIIKKARRRYALTSDIIVGFPGETVEDFEDTLRLVNACQFDSIYIFKYSVRSGTPAARLPDDVSDNEKGARFLALERLQGDIQAEMLANYVGHNVSVLIEGVSARADTDVTGHTTCNKVINLPGGKSLIGEIVDVKVREVKAHSLYGELCVSRRARASS